MRALWKGTDELVRLWNRRDGLRGQLRWGKRLDGERVGYLERRIRELTEECGRVEAECEAVMEQVRGWRAEREQWVRGEPPPPRAEQGELFKGAR